MEAGVSLPHMDLQEVNLILRGVPAEILDGAVEVPEIEPKSPLRRGDELDFFGVPEGLCQDRELEVWDTGDLIPRRWKH